MDTTTVSQFDIAKLRNLIQKSLSLPEGVVRGGWLPQASETGFFITVDLIQIQEIGVSRRVFERDTETIITSCLSQVSISVYGKEALGWANKLRSLTQSSRMLDGFKALKCGLVSQSVVRNLTSIVGADYEERGQIDLTFSHEHIITTPLEPIEQVDITVNQSFPIILRG